MDDPRRIPLPGTRTLPHAIGGARRPAAASRWAAGVVIIMVVAAFYVFGLHRYFTLEALRDYEDALSGFVAANAALSALAYVVVYVAAVGLSFPGASILTAAGGLMFGYVAGTVLALVSATAGATLLFLIARTSLGEALGERAGPRVQRLRKGFQEEGFSYLLFLRLVPLFPFWLVNLAAALFGMSLLPYIAATAIGILPGTFVLAYFGDGLGSAIGGEHSAYWVEMFAARIALIGVLVLVPVLVRKWRRRRMREQEAES